MAYRNKKYSIPFVPGSPEYQREWRRVSGYSNRRKQQWRDFRLKVLRHYSKSSFPFCACCGEIEIEFLSIDHINGKAIEGGTRRKGWTIYRWLTANNFPAGFQVLCHNCNQAKGYYSICPHQTKVKTLLKVA